ncbi:hypothetical protein ACIGNX_27555 [Actinosynnema sp. NPDC053489]|uniref:hypothetical protein n=1 Tax=Actinosynnema sp. NPDC053489 TaxID=3363916 RepID=UPI0037C51EE2
MTDERWRHADRHHADERLAAPQRRRVFVVYVFVLVLVAGVLALWSEGASVAKRELRRLQLRDDPLIDSLCVLRA